jgi:hypothetical protein
MRFTAVLSAGFAIALAGCSQVAEKAENAANRSFTSYALGKPYAEVANVGQSPMAQLSGSNATFGPDWATGSVQGSASDCVQYIGGIINRCNDMRQLQASIALYDTRVATKAGQPISSWGDPAAPAVN